MSYPGKPTMWCGNGLCDPAVDSHVPACYYERSVRAAFSLLDAEYDDVAVRQARATEAQAYAMLACATRPATLKGTP